MPVVKFTSALQRFFPDLQEIQVEGSTVSQVLAEVENLYPGITDYLLTEQGALRKHVNIYQGDTLIKDRDRLTDAVEENDELLIFQALSGG